MSFPCIILDTNTKNFSQWKAHSILLIAFLLNPNDAEPLYAARYTETFQRTYKTYVKWKHPRLQSIAYSINIRFNEDKLRLGIINGVFLVALANEVAQSHSFPREPSFRNAAPEVTFDSADVGDNASGCVVASPALLQFIISAPQVVRALHWTLNQPIIEWIESPRKAFCGKSLSNIVNNKIKTRIIKRRYSHNRRIRKFSRDSR